MKFIFSKHAKEELKRRGISMQWLDEVLQNPQQIISARDGKNVYQSKLDFGQGKIYLLRAIVKDDVMPGIVITAYRTSRIEKYWRDS